MKKSTVLIWILILVDLLSGLLLILQFPFARLGLIVKGLVIIYVLIFYLTRLRQKAISSIYLSMVILLIFWSVGFFISLLKYPDFDAIESLVVLNRYFFLLIMTCAFLDWSEYDYFETSCKKIIETFFFINNAFIFVGLLFKIKMFSTYDPYGEFGDAWRFGYKGLIWGQNSVAAIYSLGIAYYFRENFKYHHKKMIGLVTTCIAAVLLGTKASLLMLILIGGYYLFIYRIKTLIILIVPSLVGLVYILIASWSYLKSKYLGFLAIKYEELDLITFLTSGRNSLLATAIDHIKNDWVLMNFITGDAISYAEMDFFDLYFYFGISAVVYLYVYSKVYFIRDKSRDNRYVFLVWMSMAFVAGHLINSATVPIFFLLFVFSARFERKINTHESRN